ncbi:hypothetical protein JMN32_20055 [Fulvivirga sp. 29W222]|uniref:Uncharacterized protein n=1 Tax=Fulvivirga marina TaxID=2494733 RepID=A0A937G562_9BACT|nr:hypothetical protein [Fulvivirga marina]MBL6448616.1 hypothetical protein [Fulvivirga marina]
MTRLEFTMPPFRRLSWASFELKRTWEYRFTEIAVAIKKLFQSEEGQKLFPVQFHNVETHGVYQFKKILESSGLVAEVVPASSASYMLNVASTTTVRGADYTCVVAGKRKAVRAFLNDGIRNCGLPFSKAYWDAWQEFSEQNIRDPKWIYLADIIKEKEQFLKVQQDIHTNYFWEDWGISLMPFRVPKLQSEEFVTLGNEILKIAQNQLTPQLYNFWLEILSWPVEWTAMHGIAELKTPLFKTSYDTLPTGEKFVIQCHSEVYPENSPSGLLFPYKHPPKKYFSESKSFTKGLEFGTILSPKA